MATSVRQSMFAYSRVSIEEHAEKHNGLEAQQDAIATDKYTNAN
jgi:hypothetical protein